VIIRGGRLALPGNESFITSDILVKDGRVAGIGAEAVAGNGSEQDIDAGGLVVLPGCIDPHVHFDDPGYTWREDFYTGSAMAASGGVTTVIDMPCTSIPQVTNSDNLRKKLRIIERKAVVDFGLYGGVSLQSYEEDFPRNMEGLSSQVLGFKTYFISGMESFERLDHFRFREVLAAAKGLGLPVLLHAEDYDFVAEATKAAMAEGSGPREYYRSRPETAEYLAVLTACALAREVGAQLHIVHVSTADAASLLGKDGLTGETCPQYLAFDLHDFERKGAALKCTPPVKRPGNSERLWEHLADGTLRFVSSDHAPCTAKEKITGSIWTDYAGMPGSGLLLPFLFSEGYAKGRLGLKRLQEILSMEAAKQYGLVNKGSIEVGKDADLVLVDPEKRWNVQGEAFLSKGHITPFEGMELKGRVVKTLVRGGVVYEEGRGVLVEPGYGNLVTRDGDPGRDAS
jgi:allantoinase